MTHNQPISVLIVDDNPADAAWVQRSLEHLEGYHFECLHEESLDRALSRLEGCAVDIIILDLILLDSHGLETIHDVQSMAPDTSIVVLSGRADEDVAAKVMQRGVQDYLVKGHLQERGLRRSVLYSVERKRSQRH